MTLEIKSAYKKTQKVGCVYYPLQVPKTFGPATEKNKQTNKRRRSSSELIESDC